MLRSMSNVLEPPWKTAPEYQSSCRITSEKFLQVTDLLLENPNLNSTHLFRADILYDSARILRTLSEKENQCHIGSEIPTDEKGSLAHDAQPPLVEGATVQRKVLRRLIPRKPQLDRALEQWCYVYELDEGSGAVGHAVIYVPLVECEDDMPWYHPPIKSLAYIYQRKQGEGTLSVHFLPFSDHAETSPRLHRTMISLLQTFLRLAKNSSEQPVPEKKHHDDGELSLSNLSLAPSAIKDTIVPQHIVQDTYTRLKQVYAQDLISRWVEKTEPSKHVFEDLSIAAFLIELWKQMYPCSGTFPGFVDLACGNGVLAYLLIKEGYRGRGFDARRRATWKALDIEDYLDEMVCIPQAFLNHAPEELNSESLRGTGMKIHNGIFNGGFNGMPSGLFKPGTFIISNHADELTPWTPILAALSSPSCPLPFLTIPCCSHALSGAKHRYTPKDVISSATSSHINGTEEQSANGDLKALQQARMKAANHQDDKSMYACLTKKVVALAQEVGCDVELTLMRIPSTRNIGIVGNRRATFAAVNAAAKVKPDTDGRLDADVPLTGPTADDSALLVTEKVKKALERECAMSGGLTEAARTWIDRAQKLQKGQGRGKVNLGKRQHD